MSYLQTTMKLGAFSIKEENEDDIKAGTLFAKKASTNSASHETGTYTQRYMILFNTLIYFKARWRKKQAADI